MTSARGKINHIFPIRNFRWGQVLRSFLLSLIVIASFSSLSAQEIKIPERPDPPRLVNDFAGVISAGDAAAIEQKLDAYSDSTSTQIAIVTIPTLGGAEINQFATELFHTWGIGQKGKDNGVLLFIAKDDRQLFIVTGRGVEEFLPDAICKRIVEETIKPQFKAGNYAQGINAGIDEMMARLSGQFKGDPNANADNAPPIKFNIKWFFIIIIIIFVLVSIFGGGSGGNTYSSGGSSGLWFLLGMLSGGGGRGGGWGGGDSGGGGGFGGFGGGDSGGGGAGGSW